MKSTGEEGLLRVDELELHVEPSFAKKAAAFFRKSRSIVSWRFSLRSRTSSSLSAPVNAPAAGFFSSPPSASRTQLRSADSVKSRSLATWGRLLLPSRTSLTASALNSGVKLRLFLLSMDTTSRVADLRGMSTKLGQAQL